MQIEALHAPGGAPRPYPAAPDRRRVLPLQESIDTTTPGGRLVFHVFAALAEFERDLIRDRTLDGLEDRNSARRPRTADLVIWPLTSDVASRLHERTCRSVPQPAPE